ncbi:Protein of unknown function [Saccharopolyspora antimicrobica]|uniref:Uncharacterized protein DUF664 n=1 Tax=Saccharopolyspora antimicrobica TaxID=455193 RepID=A0A1I5GM64_9PSEU|nr:DUF664 domain-containing protein [Saccharopolyspora antimicrobica]RKT87467.1 uncharacterized protein DUF664 [Saccharopolyspora antimicrobica]SFO37043.1 Protein of unknown function [Saccharopolyspora antimicrobica]
MTIRHRRWPDEDATDELRLSQEFLQFLRHTAVGKVDGLSPELAAAAPIATSPRTTALGVIKHLTAVERHWISIVGAGAPLPSLWEGSPDPSWNLTAADSPRTVIAAYEAEWERSTCALAGLSPDGLAADGERTIRWILAHVTQETARHVGHLDLLRELADGEAGE